MFESTMNILSMYVDIESKCTYDVLEARLEKTKMEMLEQHDRGRE